MAISDPDRGTRRLIAGLVSVTGIMTALWFFVAKPTIEKQMVTTKEMGAKQVLRALQLAEEVHFARGRVEPTAAADPANPTEDAPAAGYADLEGLLPVENVTLTDDGVDPQSGYTFEISADEEHYTITATPPDPHMTSFTLMDPGSAEDETGGEDGETSSTAPG